MSKLKAIVAASLGLLAGVQAGAHDNYNYLNITAGGGLHTMLHNPDNLENIQGDGKLGAGGVVNVNYIHFFGKSFGLGTGLGFSYNQSRSIINGMDVNKEYDAYNKESFDFQMIYVNWQEIQRAFVLELPLGFYGRKDLNEKMAMLIGVGGKLTFPVAYKYAVDESENGTIETKGYYPNTNALLYNLPHHGFGVDDTPYSGSNKNRLGFSVYLDLGFNHWLNEKLAFYWGIYGNYGITDMVKSHQTALYDFNGNYAGVHASNMVDKVNMLSAGVKIGVTLAFGKKPEPEVKDTVFVKDTVDNLVEELILQTPDTLAADSSWVDVADMIEKLPNWNQFNYKNKEALEAATKAFAALSDSAKQEMPDKLRDKLSGLNMKVAQSTVQNLENSLKIKHSYGFAFSSSDGHFTDEQQEYMHFIADCLKMNPQAKISVVGYTCNIGSEDMNEVFGYDRAIHVRNYIVRFGAFEDQIIMDTRTSKDPIAPNDCEKNRAKNRRTEINLIKK